MPKSDFTTQTDNKKRVVGRNPEKGLQTIRDEPDERVCMVSEMTPDLPQPKAKAIADGRQQKKLAAEQREEELSRLLKVNGITLPSALLLLLAGSMPKPFGCVKGSRGLPLAS